jgi:peptide deformylase
MKSQSLLNFAIFGMMLISIIGCTEHGFRPVEVKKITQKSEQATLPLLTIENKSDSLFLRQVSRKVDKENIGSKHMKQLKNRMLATISDSLNSGVGLAAPQVGIGVKMILVQRFDKANEPFEFYFNPKIKEYSDSINSGFEGCLSVPGYRGHVQRSQNILVSYRDSSGTKMEETISDFTAVIFQHEVDHLNGIFYFDHVFGGFHALMPAEE